MRKYFLKENGKIASIAIPEDHQINSEVARKIREKYSIEDELKARRVGGSFATEVDTYITECVGIGNEKKAAALADRDAYSIQLDNSETAEAELMGMTKTALVAYAELIGFSDISGLTKQAIADKILIAGGLK